MKIGHKLTELRAKKRLTQDQMADLLGVKRPRYNAWENDISRPDLAMLNRIADVHKVSVDALLGRTAVQQGLVPAGTLTAREEKDLAADLERMIAELESEDALAFHGEPMDEEAKELMKISLENSLRLAKSIAKQKFTPHKHRSNKGAR